MRLDGLSRQIALTMGAIAFGITVLIDLGVAGVPASVRGVGYKLWSGE